MTMNSMLPLIAHKRTSDRDSLAKLTGKLLTSLQIPDQSYGLTLSYQNLKFLPQDSYYFGEDKSIKISKNAIGAEILIRPDIARDSIIEILDSTLQGFSFLETKITKSSGILHSSEIDTNLVTSLEDRCDWIKLTITDRACIGSPFEVEGPCVITIFSSVNRRMQRILLVYIEFALSSPGESYKQLVYILYTALASEKMTLLWLGFEPENQEANDYYRINNETRYFSQINFLIG